MIVDCEINEKLNVYPMIGLSADWIYRTWLMSGSLERGIVVFENEDSGVFELVSFYFCGEDRFERVLISGTIESVLNNLNAGK